MEAFCQFLARPALRKLFANFWLHRPAFYGNLTTKVCLLRKLLANYWLQRPAFKGSLWPISATECCQGSFWLGRGAMSNISFNIVVMALYLSPYVILNTTLFFKIPLVGAPHVNFVKSKQFTECFARLKQQKTCYSNSSVPLHSLIQNIIPWIYI
jgi:hypothetical protein